MFDTRRSEIEIIKEIIEISNAGAKKTELLYQGNLSYTLLQNYLGLLLQHEILEERHIPTNGNNGRSRLYFTTKKGHTLLKDINQMMTHFR